MARPMDPDRPLWELLVVPGAASDGPGLVLRIHHAVADGVVGVAMLGALLDERTGSDRNDGGAPSDPAARQSPPVPPPGRAGGGARPAC